MKKRILSLILVCVFVLSMIPATLSAAPVKASVKTTAAQDGYSVVSGNDDTITKDVDGTYLVSRKGAKDTIVKKGNATLEEGWISLDMPVGSAYQMRRKQGIIFGVNDLTNLSSGTHYFAYIECTNDGTNQYVRLAEVKDGTATKISADYQLDGVLNNIEVMELDSIELSVYFTKDGVIKLYIQDICVYSTTGKTISGNKYAIQLSDSISGTVTRASADYAFNSLTTKGFADYKLYYGGWDMGAKGITSAQNFNSSAIDNRSLWLANDTHGDETVFHFSIKDYKNGTSGTTSANDTNTGIVFGVTAPSVEQNKGFYNGKSYAYYHVYLQYKTSGDAVIGIARCDMSLIATDAEPSKNYAVLKTKNVKDFGADCADGDSNGVSNWIDAGKAVNGNVYYNALTGDIRVTLDSGNGALTYTESAENLANRTNVNGRGYGVRANAYGVAVDVEKLDVVSHTSPDFEDIRGDFVYLEDGSAVAISSSVAYSTEKIKGNDVWYHFSASDFGKLDTGFILGAHKGDDYTGEWENKTKGYCLFVYNNGNICIGRFGVSYTKPNGDPSTWYGLTQKPLRSNTYWMKGADAVSGEAEGIYEVRVHQIFDPATSTNTFDVYVGGYYQGTMVDDSGLGFSPAGGNYGYRCNILGTFRPHKAEIVEYPSWLDMNVKNQALGNASTKRAIAYDEKTGFFRSALVDDTNIIMSKKNIAQATSGKKTIYYSVDMQKMKYGMNADDGIVFGASYSDANYNNSATWYCLILGDQRDSNSNENRVLRLLKYTGAVETGATNPNAFPEVVNGKSTDKISTPNKFEYTPGDVIRFKIAVEYDLDNGITTINAYANGVHVFKFVDTIANEGKNDRLPSVGTHALTGTAVGVRTEASSTRWANLIVSEIDNIDDLPPAPATADDTAVWVSIVALATLAVVAVVSFKKKERV